MLIAGGRKTFPANVALLFALGLFAWLCFVYASTFSSLRYAWAQEEYSHGFLVPIISALWGARLLQKTPVVPNGSLLGVFLLFMGVSLNSLGQLVANNWLSQISLIFSITGILALFLGNASLRILAAPIAFLIFAIPLPATVAPALTANMQMVSSTLGVKGLQLLGVSVYQEGNIIDLGINKLQVAEACSGLRYLFPLMSLGYLIAFHGFKTQWKRLVLFLSTIPIAILTNGFRLTLTGIASNWFGIAAVQGVSHELEGFAVFVVGLTSVLGVKWAIEGLSKREDTGNVENWLPAFRVSFWAQRPTLSRSTAVACLLTLALFTVVEVLVKPSLARPAPSRLAFAAFPLNIGDFRGETDVLSLPELQSLKLTDYLLTRYVQDGSGLPVTFYIAYYESQRQGSSIHSPQICLPGAGWEILSRTRRPISLSSGTVVVNRETIQKGNQKQLVYYWYREGGVDVATSLDAKLQLIKSAFGSGRTDGSLIRLTTPVFEAQSETSADALLELFMGKALPLLPGFLPKE